ncbi:MAG: lysophospholipid acyltransferase family protein [Bacteroidota bacterium]
METTPQADGGAGERDFLDMIHPRYNRTYQCFWSWYFRHIIRSDFAAMNVFNAPELEADKSVLLLQNHISWWDGFWAYRMNDLHFKRQFHVMMLEEELRPRKFLTYAGAFSIQKNSRSMVESLNFCGQLLQNPKNLLLLFPQGEIESAQTPSLAFGSGVQRVVKKSADAAQVILSACFVDYFSERKPTLSIYLEHIPSSEVKNIVDWKTKFNQFFEQQREVYCSNS